MSRLRFALLILLPLAVMLTACGSYQPPKKDTSALSQRETGARQDCNAMMGTAFRGAEERTWFEANCSRWPAVSLAVIPPAPPAGQQPRTATTAIQGDTAECAAMRGRPYSNEQERSWFLQNCIRQEQTAPNTTNAAPQTRPGTAPVAPVVNANAGTCEALRRMVTPTDDQRRWYFTNCDVR